MNLKTENIIDLQDDQDPLRFMRNEFLDDLRKHIAKKKIEIQQWEFTVLKNYPNNG